MSPATVRACRYDRLLDEGRAFLRHWTRESAVLVVAASRMAADELNRSACAEASAGVHRFGLDQLAARLAEPAFNELGLASAGSICRQAIAALCARRAELQYFSAIAGLPGFPGAFATTASELRLARSTGGMNGPGAADLASLLRLYSGELESRRLADKARVYELAVAAAGKGLHPYAGLPLLLLGVAPGNASERLLLEALVAQSRAVLRLEMTPAGLEGASGLEAASAVEPASALESAQRFLFSAEKAPERAADASLDVFSASGEALECVEIARRILQAAEAGVPFDEIAILLRHPATYAPLVEEALRRAGIPVWFTAGAARPHVPGRAFLALLYCAAEDVSAARFAEFLSLGQTPDTAAEDEFDEAAPVEHRSLWERLLTEARVIRGAERWGKRLRLLREDLRGRYEAAGEEAEQAALRRKLDGLDALERFALPVVQRLASLPQSANWSEWLAHLYGLAEACLREPGEVCGLLDELQALGEIGPVTVEDVVATLEPHLTSRRAEPAAYRYGGVFAGGIEEARGMSFRQVFVPALCEGSFPARSKEDPLWPDEYRKAADAALAPDRDEAEKTLLRIALACARERCVVSWPRTELLTGRARVPSFYAFEVVRAARGAVDLRTFEADARSNTQTRIGWPAPVDAADAIDDAEFDLATLRPAFEGENAKGAAAYLTRENEHAARALRSRWSRWESKKWTLFDGLTALDIEAEQLLQQHGLGAKPYSPSTLQQYAICPYRFAMRGIYGLRAMEGAEPLDRMSAALRGSLLHRVQFELLRELQAAGQLPVNEQNLAAAQQALDSVTDRLGAEFIETHAPSAGAFWRADMESIRLDLRIWLQLGARNEADWTPVAFELAFGLKPDADHDRTSAPEAVEVFAGLRVRGSIDLVERHSTGIVRVTDHKSGRVPQTLPRMMGGGESLQPLLYALAAAKLVAGEVAEGRLYYVSLRENFRQIDVRVTNQARAHAERVLRNIDDAVRSGFLPPAPRKGACDTCEYVTVCGPWEEERTARKSQPELKPLLEIRSLP